jgi:hypothetical protein
MDELIRRLENLGSEVSHAQIDDVHTASLNDPESLSEVNMRFYFKSGDVHYIVSIERPDMDGTMLEHNMDDFYTMFFFGGRSPEQQRMIDNGDVSQRIIRINEKTHTIDVLTMKSYLESPAKKAVLEPGNIPVTFSAKSWKYEKDPWSLDPSYENISMRDLDSLLHKYRHSGEIKPDEVLADVLPKLRKAAFVYRERLAEYQRSIR